MSIQSAFNQALATAGIAQRLHQSTPEYQAAQATKEAKTRYEERRGVTQDLLSKAYTNVHNAPAPDKIEIEQHPELFKGEQGQQLSNALDIQGERNIEDAKIIAAASPTAKNISELVRIQSRVAERHAQREAMLKAQQSLTEAQYEKRWKQMGGVL